METTDDFQEDQEGVEPKAIRHTPLTVVALFSAFAEDVFTAFANFWQTAGRMLVEHWMYREQKRIAKRFERDVQKDLDSLNVQE